MSFLSGLGRVLKGVGKGIAGIAGVSSGAAQNSSDQRLSQLQLALQEAQNQNVFGLNSANQQNTFNQNRTNQQNQGLMDRFQLSTQLPSLRANQARLGGLQANVQDFKLTRNAEGRLEGSGGLRPSAMGAGARQAGAELERQALLGLMGGDAANMPAYDPGPDFVSPGAYTSSTEAYAQQPKSGTLEKILGGIGLGGSVLGAIQTPSLAELLRRQQAQQPPPPSGVMPGLGTSVRNVRF